jgi:hypothetical protein
MSFWDRNAMLILSSLGLELKTAAVFSFGTSSPGEVLVG